MSKQMCRTLFRWKRLQDPVNACVHWQRAKKHAAYDDYCTLETQIAAVDEDAESAVNN